MADNMDNLLEQVHSARDRQETLQIRGNGSKDFMGRSTQCTRTLSLAEHSGIVDYQPVELVLTARAGTTISEIQTLLDAHGQMLTCESPTFAGKATLGGTLACNLSGPARPWAGSIRDLVLGIRLLNGLGEHLKFGGQVMKNVAGYDVARAQAGAMGCLGAITEVSLKVMPKPEASLTLIQEMDQEHAIQHMNQLAATPKPLTAACWHGGLLYLRLAGAEQAVRGTVSQWGGEPLKQGDAFWASLREHTHPFFAGAAPLWRLSIRPTATACTLSEDTLLDWSGAQRWLPGDLAAGQVQAFASQAGGQASLYRGGDRTGEVNPPLSPILQRFQQNLKAAFDPDRIFNPGRLYSWL